MKRIYYLLALLVLTGCSKKEHSEETGKNDFLQIGKAVLTSSGVTSEWNNTALGVSILPQGETLNPEASGFNAQLQYTENGWVSQPVLQWTNNAEGTICDLIAYAPYTATISDPSALPLKVAADQSQPEAPQQNDWLYSRSSVTKSTSNEPIQIELDHALSRLAFEVIFDGEYIGTSGIEALTISLKNDGTIDLNNGAVSVTGNETPMSPCLLEVAPQGVNQLYELTVLPQDVSSEKSFVSFSINGKSFEKSVSAQFEAGKCYTYRLKIGQDSDPILLALEPLSITQWEEEKVDMPATGMDPEEYQAGDLWPNAENPIAYVVRARENHRPGIMVTIQNKIGTLFKSGGYFETLTYTDPNGMSHQAASSRTDGVVNLQTLEICLPQSNPVMTWENLPALNYARSLGTDWFIPAADQWQTILDQIESEVWTDLLNHYWTSEVINWSNPLPDFIKTGYVYSSTMNESDDQGITYTLVGIQPVKKETVQIDDVQITNTTTSYTVIAVRYF